MHNAAHPLRASIHPPLRTTQSRFVHTHSQSHAMRPRDCRREASLLLVKRWVGMAGDRVPIFKGASNARPKTRCCGTLRVVGHFPPPECRARATRSQWTRRSPQGARRTQPKPLDGPLRVWLLLACADGLCQGLQGEVPDTRQRMGHAGVIVGVLLATAASASHGRGGVAFQRRQALCASRAQGC